MTDSSTHTSDEQCAVDSATNCCTTCGVEHGDPCTECGGRGFHKSTCAAVIIPLHYQDTDNDNEVACTICCGMNLNPYVFPYVDHADEVALMRHLSQTHGITRSNSAAFVPQHGLAAGELCVTLPGLPSRRDLVRPAALSIRQVSCGCCTNGCVCFMHRDVPRGVRQQQCAVHSTTGQIKYI